MIRVFIAEDHAMMREGIRKIIDAYPGMETIGEAADGVETIERLGKMACDLLLMDMTMPRIGGVDLIRRVKQLFPKLPILVMSMHDAGTIVAAAIKAGANGYITKNAEPARFSTIIRSVAAGGEYIEPHIAKRAFIEGGSEQQPHETLTERENQIMCMIVNGKSTKQIGEELYLSPKTVSTHKMRILEKLNIENVADLIRYALKHHLSNSA